MILTVTANIAIDRTYVIDRLEVGQVHKVKRVYAHTGGKGVNVSRSVRSLGGDTLVTGLIGGAAMAEATGELAAAGLESSLFAVDGPARQTVTVTAEDGSTTAFDEPGPAVGEQEWSDFVAHVGGLLPRAEMVVIAGSLPPGAPEAALAQLCEQANGHAVPVVLDARGAVMRAAQEQGPLVAKLNRVELEQTVGRELDGDQAVIDAAHELLAAGSRYVVVTLGERGALGVGHAGSGGAGSGFAGSGGAGSGFAGSGGAGSGGSAPGGAGSREQIWRVTHPAAEGNPIGAGDAFSAALALALTQQRAFAEALREGAAAALASLRTPTAGALDAAEFRAVLPAVQIHRYERAVA